VLLEDPVDLLLLAPHDVPVIGVHLPPLASDQALVHAVAERCFELDGGAELARRTAGSGSSIS
jgi:hypothetical protein